MKQTPANGTAEQHVREIRRQTREKYSAEEKIRIVISGRRGEHSIAELCRREGIAESLCYVWSRDPGCRSSAHSRSSASRGRSFTAGTACTGASASSAWKIAGLRLDGARTGCRTRSGAR
jgi:transposase-like protein